VTVKLIRRERHFLSLHYPDGTVSKGPRSVLVFTGKVWSTSPSMAATVSHRPASRR
jgi:hypothetical protein